MGEGKVELGDRVQAGRQVGGDRLANRSGCLGGSDQHGRPSKPTGGPKAAQDGIGDRPTDQNEDDRADQHPEPVDGEHVVARDQLSVRGS